MSTLFPLRLIFISQNNKKILLATIDIDDKVKVEEFTQDLSIHAQHFGFTRLSVSECGKIIRVQNNDWDHNIDYFETEAGKCITETRDWIKEPMKLLTTTDLDWVRDNLLPKDNHKPGQPIHLRGWSGPPIVHACREDGVAQGVVLVTCGSDVHFEYKGKKIDTLMSKSHVQLLPSLDKDMIAAKQLLEPLLLPCGIIPVLVEVICSFFTITF
jgi:hypothetical protein